MCVQSKYLLSQSQVAQVLCRCKHTGDVNSPSLLFYDRLRHSINIWQTSRHHMEATEPRLLYYSGSEAVSSRMIYCHIAPAVHLHRCDVTNLESSSPCQECRRDRLCNRQYQGVSRMIFPIRLNVAYPYHKYGETFIQREMLRCPRLNTCINIGSTTNGRV